jgi:hypothetical protein
MDSPKDITISLVFPYCHMVVDLWFGDRGLPLWGLTYYPPSECCPLVEVG